MICSKIYKICMNVGMCEMCRPDTHALQTAIRLIAISMSYRISETFNYSIQTVNN